VFNSRHTQVTSFVMKPNFVFMKAIKELLKYGRIGSMNKTIKCYFFPVTIILVLLLSIAVGEQNSLGRHEESVQMFKTKYF